MNARVMVVDDQPLIRDALENLLVRDGMASLVAAVGSSAEALEVARTDALDLAIIEVMPAPRGIQLTRRIKQTQPTCKVLGLSHVTDAPRIAAILRAGADGYALKSQPTCEILAAVKCVLASQSYLPEAVDGDAVARLLAIGEAGFDGLTARQHEVYELLVAGHTNEAIAARLSIARRTVESHRQMLMRKLGVHSIVELVHLSLLGRA